MWSNVLCVAFAGWNFCLVWNKRKKKRYKCQSISPKWNRLYSLTTNTHMRGCGYTCDQQKRIKHRVRFFTSLAILCVGGFFSCFIFICIFSAYGYRHTVWHIGQFVSVCFYPNRSQNGNKYNQQKTRENNGTE